ncbi:MAG: ATP-binding protein [Cyclobacteriaceae bacterium]
MYNTETKDNIIRIILKCNQNGAVFEVLLDHAGIFSEREIPVPVHELIAPDSLEALGDFWIKVLDKGMQEQTQLNITHFNDILKFTFSGYLIHENILLCGSTEYSAVEKVMDEMMLIYNEQLNRIRLAEKKIKMAQKKENNYDINELMLNDFSEINNELINKQRELSRKNTEVHRLNSELQAAKESMEMFAYSVSHDLKEPVRMVNAFISRLKKHYGEDLDEKGRKYLHFALDGAKRLDKMIADLLHFYRAANDKKYDLVDLNEVLDEVKLILQRQIQERKTKISHQNLPKISGSSTGLKQVFQNLIANAIKFVPGDRTPDIKIFAVEKDLFWEFQVSDNGIGIDKSHQEEIFKLFKQVGDLGKQEGSGMGLAIVKRIIEHMRGKIWLNSEQGKGTTFHFSLPKLSYQ